MQALGEGIVHPLFVAEGLKQPLADGADPQAAFTIGEQCRCAIDLTLAGGGGFFPAASIPGRETVCGWREHIAETILSEVAIHKVLGPGKLRGHVRGRPLAGKPGHKGLHTSGPESSILLREERIVDSRGNVVERVYRLRRHARSVPDRWRKAANRLAAAEPKTIMMVNRDALDWTGVPEGRMPIRVRKCRPCVGRRIFFNREKAMISGSGQELAARVGRDPGVDADED